jgi:hypothetical protein
MELELGNSTSVKDVLCPHLFSPLNVPFLFMCLFSNFLCYSVYVIKDGLA